MKTHTTHPDKMHRRPLLLAVAAGLASLLSPASARAGLIYSDTFNGSSANGLTGTTPGTTSGTFGGTAGATWSAKDEVFKADGSVVTGFGGGSAALPFTPQTGQKYTLSATVDTTVGGANWIGLGFEEHSFPPGAFDLPDNNGYAWMILRETRGGNQGAYLLGPTITGPSGSFDTGSGPLNLAVVLDTSAANWTAQYFVDGSAVSAAVAYAVNPTIGFAGFSTINSGGGTVDNFSLDVAPVPEPGTLAVGLLCLGAGMARRRRSARVA